MSPRPLTTAHCLLITVSLITALLLASCASQTASPPPDYSPPDYSTPDHPTPDHPTPDYSTPDYSTPDYQTPDYQTPTPTPEVITLTGTFGLSPDIAKAFYGAEKSIRKENGQYLLTASYRDPQTGRLKTQDFVLDPASFSFDKALAAKNPLAPATVDVTDEKGQKQTLIFDQEKREFRLAADLPAIYDSVNTDTPAFNPEAFDQIPHFTVEDIQSGLPVQSLLVQFQERLASGESLADILYLNPDAVKESWQKFGGNSLLFELLRDGKVARLKTRGNDRAYEGSLRYDNMTMKVLPFGANVEINGENYFAFYIANFDPLDPKNPDPTDLANWKFFLNIPTYAGEPVNPADPNSPIGWKDSFRVKNPLTPYIFLYADPTFQQNHPLLAQLLGIEGNDPGNLIFPRYNNKLIDDFNNEFSLLSSSNPVREILISWDNVPQPFDTNVQKYLFLFEAGAAQ